MEDCTRRRALHLGALGLVATAGCVDRSASDPSTPTTGNAPEPAAQPAPDRGTETGATGTDAEPQTPPSSPAERAADAYAEDANLYDGIVVDRTGQDEVTVKVGAGEGFAFDPPVFRVDVGATVHWEWTGEGGAHNVVSANGTFDSGSPVAEPGQNFSRSFDDAGTYRFYCAPHEGQGMLGVVLVGANPPVTPLAEQPGPSMTSLPDPVRRAVRAHAEDANLSDGTLADRTGQEEVTVDVGAGEGFAFDPPVLRVDVGTTVNWTWTGDGGAHNVVSESGAFDSGDIVSEAGHTFTWSVDEAGTYGFHCLPHKAVGMKGVILAGAEPPATPLADEVGTTEDGT